MAMAGVSSAINVNQQNTLTENEQEIIRLMDIENVLPRLQRRGILDHNDIGEIRRQKNMAMKVQRFIGTLSVRGDQAFSSLIEALRESRTSKHKQLADKLENRFKSPVPRPNKHLLMVATLKDHEGRLKTLEDDTRARDQVEKFNEMLESKEAELEEVKAKLQQQENDANGLKEENDKLKQRVDELEAEMNDLRAEKAKVEEDLKAMKERMATMEQKNEDLQEKHDMFQQQMTQKFDELTMRIDNVDTGRNPTGVSSRPQIEPRNRFQQNPSQPTGSARRPEAGVGANRPAATAGARRPAAGVGANRPAATAGQRRPAAGVGTNRPAAGGGANKSAAGGGANRPAAGGGANKSAAGGGPGAGAINPRR